ncbi:MAG: hypothetical protein K0S37_1331 [Microbacterium sp.]|jgi:hypothetical protein|nr:hypothetical protein [Microbacterium sp.]
MSTPVTTTADMYGDDSGFVTDNPIYADPDITSDLLLEYNADSLGNVGTSVSTWASSGGALGAVANLSGGSPSKPTVVAGPNGHKAVRFDAAASQYLRTAVFGAALGLPLTEVAVVRPTSTNTGAIISGAFIDNKSYFASLRRISTGYDAGAGASGELVNASSADTAGFHAVSVRHGANALLRVDTVESPGVTGQAQATRDLATLPRVTIGANSGANQQFFAGDISLIRIFGRAFTDEDLDSLHATLAAEYGITI